jgi:hypothetical protein
MNRQKSYIHNDKLSMLIRFLCAFHWLTPALHETLFHKFNKAIINQLFVWGEEGSMNRCRKPVRFAYLLLIIAVPFVTLNTYPVMASSKVTVAAYDNAVRSDVEVNVLVDGQNYITPYSFTFDNGVHNFSFPDKDTYGHPFAHCYIWYSNGAYQYVKTKDLSISLTPLNQSDFTLKAYYHLDPYSDKHPALIYVDVPTKSIGINESFSINIGVRNVKNLFAWELVAYYPKDIMMGLSIDDAAYLNRIYGAPWIFLVDGYGINGYCTLPFQVFGGNFTPYNDYNSTHGWVHVASTIINSVGVYPGVNGTGILVSITFKKQNNGRISFTVAQKAQGWNWYTFLLDASLEETPSCVGPVGDLTGPQGGVPDGKVDIRDVSLEARNFGVNEENPNWDPWLDLTGVVYLEHDCMIDMRDIALVASRFGQTIT